MKICLIGPDSVHIRRFYADMKMREPEFVMIAEEKISWFEGRQIAISFRSMNGMELLKRYRAAKAFLRSEKPDVVHIHQINRLAVILGKAARAEGCKIIETAWGSDVLLVPKRNKFYAALTRSALKKADVITADARMMINSMRRLHPGGNYKIWQYGIDPITREVPKEKIIYSNRMHEPLYRIDQIIGYYSEFYRDHPDWKLIIGGSGSLTSELEDKVKKLKISDAVHFPGYCDAAQNAAFYSKASVFVSIPESDGTSVSLLEAMSAGCIPVVSDLEVNRELIVPMRNGVVEQKGQNPLFRVLEIDRKVAVDENERLTRSLSRTEMNRQMIELYKSLL